jgi:hypothetical protein
MGYTGTTSIYTNSFEGAYTIPNSVVHGGSRSITTVGFVNGSSTVTLSQATGVRAISGHTIQSAFLPSQPSSVTVSHMAGILVLAPYYVNSNTPTITNYYGFVMNDSTEYSSTLSITNRWGIYQQGASDKNYLNGTTLIGTATDPGLGKLHVSGGISTDTPTGGTSQKWKLGQYNATAPTATGYVEVEVNGVLYKLLAAT